MSDEFVVRLFNFIRDNGKDVDPDHYQVAFRPSGLGVRIVLKYIHSDPDREVELGKIGL